MPDFKWDKMRATPEGALERSQGKLTIEQLAELSRPMAERIIDAGMLIDDVRRNMDEIINGTDGQREEISRGIADRNPGAIPDHVEEDKDIAALILEIAKVIRERDDATRRKSN